MRIIALTEHTQAWREWRRGGLGASDAPVLCGVSRYRDRESLWREKRLAAAAAPDDNWKLVRGRVLEPRARELYEERFGYAIPSRCVAHEELSFVRASLDGYCEERRIAVELKAPGRAEHEEALRGIVPARFVPQCLHVLLVTDGERMHYASYRPEFSDARALAIVELWARPTALAELLEIERAFWRSVQSGEFPPTFRPAFAGIRTRVLMAASSAM